MGGRECRYKGRREGGGGGLEGRKGKEEEGQQDQNIGLEEEENSRNTLNARPIKVGRN